MLVRLHMFRWVVKSRINVFGFHYTNCCMDGVTYVLDGVTYICWVVKSHNNVLWFSLPQHPYWMVLQGVSQTMIRVKFGIK